MYQSTEVLYWVLGFVAYYLIIYSLKALTYKKDIESPNHLLMPWHQGHEFTLLVSPDFWFANCFKNRIKYFSPKKKIKKRHLSEFIKLNNSANLLLSALFFLALDFSRHIEQTSAFTGVLLSMAFVRYISRSYEIAYAFGRDVFQRYPSQSGLNKYDRIKLALLSYIEVFIYSASAYFGLPNTREPIDAFSMSLNVGTLTNVGYAFGSEATCFHNMVFVQVFCTLSLVVLSLASYLSRKK